MSGVCGVTDLKRKLYSPFKVVGRCLYGFPFLRSITLCGFIDFIYLKHLPVLPFV